MNETAIRYLIDVANGTALNDKWKDEYLKIHNETLYEDYRNRYGAEGDILLSTKFSRMMGGGGLLIPFRRFRMRGQAKLGIYISREELKNKIRTYKNDPAYEFRPIAN